MIYLDWAATGKLHPCAMQAISNSFEFWANPGGIYSSARKAKAFLESLRMELKTLTNAEYIIFTSGATEANNMVLSSARGRVLTTNYEHPSIKNFPKAEIIKLDNLKDELKKGPALVSISYIQHETGLIRDIKHINQLCNKYYAKLHIDAAQAKDISKIEADYITISSHKIGGPIGIGALITHQPIKPILYGGEQENYMRPGTQPIPLIAGFLAAINNLISNDFYKQHFKELKEIIKKNIAKEFLFETYLEGNWADHIVCLLTEKIPGSEIAAFMDLNSIEIGIGSACTTGALEGMEMLKLIGKNNGIRISFGWQTKADEVEKFCIKFNEFMSKRNK